jgi:hypothetical protein
VSTVAIACVISQVPSQDGDRKAALDFVRYGGSLKSSPRVPLSAAAGTANVVTRVVQSAEAELSDSHPIWLAHTKVLPIPSSNCFPFAPLL